MSSEAPRRHSKLVARRREVGNSPNENARQNVYSEAPTRRYDNPPLEAPYPSVFVPPTYAPPAQYQSRQNIYQPPASSYRSDIAASCRHRHTGEVGDDACLRAWLYRTGGIAARIVSRASQRGKSSLSRVAGFGSPYRYSDCSNVCLCDQRVYRQFALAAGLFKRRSLYLPDNLDASRVEGRAASNRAACRTGSMV